MIAHLFKALPMTIILTGCANGIPDITSEKPEAVVRRTRKMFVGVPVLLSMEGSFVALDDKYAVTVAHNKAILDFQNKEYWIHPTCDIAVFRNDSDETANVGLVYKGEAIYHSGYPIGLPMAYNEGSYTGEVDMNDRKGCTQSLTSSVIMQGMSGGGAWNSKGELVGVNVGYTNYVTFPDGSIQESPGVFQSLYGVKDWLKEVTGNDYFNGR